MSRYSRGMSNQLKWVVPIVGIAIGLLALLPILAQDTRTSPESEQIILLNAHIIPMNDEVVFSDLAVIIEGSRILDVCPVDTVDRSNQATIIDCQGGYLMPGLADMHMHTWTDWPEDYAIHPLELYVAKGITTIRCLGPGGTNPEYVLEWREAITQHEQIGPSILTSGDVLNSPLKHPAAAVRSQDRQGFDFIKPYSFLSRSDLQAVLTEAQKRGLYSVGHLPYAVSLDEALVMGMDEIAHIEELAWELIDFDRDQDLTSDEWTAYAMEMVMTQHADALSLTDEELRNRYAPKLQQVAEQLLAADATVCTTLVVGDTIAMKLHDPLAFLARPGTPYLSRSYMQRFLNGCDRHQQQLQGLETLAQFKRSLETIILQEMHQAGVRLVAGTDAGTGVLGIPAGFALHDELNLLVRYGLTPFEALSTCTRVAGEIAARMVGIQEFGLLEPDLRADLVLLAENPLESLDALDTLQGVMLAGQWFDEFDIEQMLEIPADEAPIELQSAWRDQPVILDGRITNDSEWASATSLDLQLRESNIGPRSIPSTWWMMNDADWLYILVRLPTQSPAIDAATISHFWPYPFPTQTSDYTWINTQGETWDACCFDFDTWRWKPDSFHSPEGGDQIEGASAHTAGSRWFEFRKPLDSHDGCDWTFSPGGSYGVQRTGPLNLGAVTSNPGQYYEQGILLHVAQDPLMTKEPFLEDD